MTIPEWTPELGAALSAGFGFLGFVATLLLRDRPKDGERPTDKRSRKERERPKREPTTATEVAIKHHAAESIGSKPRYVCVGCGGVVESAVMVMCWACEAKRNEQVALRDAGLQDAKRGEPQRDPFSGLPRYRSALEAQQAITSRAMAQHRPTDDNPWAGCENVPGVVLPTDEDAERAFNDGFDRAWDRMEGKP